MNLIKIILKRFNYSFHGLSVLFTFAIFLTLVYLLLDFVNSNLNLLEKVENFFIYLDLNNLIIFSINRQNRVS